MSLRILNRLGLLHGAYRAYERLRGLGGRSQVTAGGLPVPPRRLIVRVAGTADRDWFLESGHMAAQAIAASLERNGSTLRKLRSLLDFGCGCGRVVRHWRSLPGQVHGTDNDPELIAWCRRNLDFASFARNTLRPPLPYADSVFDFVYSLSVFTHLPEELQRPWMSELRRVLRPGGQLLITTHGERYLERLGEEERERFRAGELVVRWEHAAGTNLCTAFHPRDYVEQVLADGLQLLEFVPEGAAGNPYQDLVLFRKSQEA